MIKETFLLKDKLRYYSELILVTALATFLGYTVWTKIGISFYEDEHLPNVLFVFILFFLLSFSFTMGIAFVEKILRKIFHHDFLLSEVVVRALIGALIVAVTAGSFEIIYELAFNNEHINPSTQTLFVIDQSGSMKGSDGNDIRLKAAKKIIKDNKGIEFGAITFSDEIIDSIPVATNNKQQLEYMLSNQRIGGGTDIGRALSCGKNTFDEKENTKSRSVLLMTDGVSEPFEQKRTIDEYNKGNIKINSLALGDGADYKLLEELSKGTGGKVAKVNNPYFIKASYNILTGKRLKRCLLMPNLLLGEKTKSAQAMQIIFLFIIGVVLQLNTFLILFHDVEKKYVKYLIFVPLFVGAAAALVTLKNASESTIVALLVVYVTPMYLGRISIKPKRAFKGNDNTFLLDKHKCTKMNNKLKEGIWTNKI